MLKLIDIQYSLVFNSWNSSTKCMCVDYHSLPVWFATRQDKQICSYIFIQNIENHQRKVQEDNANYLFLERLNFYSGASILADTSSIIKNNNRSLIIFISKVPFENKTMSSKGQKFKFLQWHRLFSFLFFSFSSFFFLWTGKRFFYSDNTMA